MITCPICGTQFKFKDAALCPNCVVAFSYYKAQTHQTIAIATLIKLDKILEAIERLR